MTIEIDSFSNLVEDQDNAKLLVDLIEGKISNKEFKESEIYNSILKSLALDTSSDEGLDAKRFLQALEVNDKSSLNNFLKNHSYDDDEFEKEATVENFFFLFLQRELASDLNLCEEDRSYKPQSFLVKLFGDKVFIKQAEKDKQHILDLQNDLKEIQNYLNKQSEAIRKFVNVNIGWFDEPFMNGDYNDLKDLLNQALKECDLWIEEEKNGKNLRSVYPEYFHISMSSNQSDSWEEWKYIFPNVYKYLGFC